MRFSCRMVLPAILAVAVAACVPQPGPVPEVEGPRTDLVIVRPFGVPDRVVTLDRSFGFSLQRGAPGVPLRERAASVGRAVAFQVSDALADGLRAQGFDVVRSENAPLSANRRTLVIGGYFRVIDEGLRRRGHSVARGAGASEVAADVRIDYSAPGMPARELTTLQADSAEGGVHRADVNADARRFGQTLARTIADLARRGKWFAAPGT